MDSPQDRPLSVEQMSPSARRRRYDKNRKDKTAANAVVAERQSQRALLLGGGAPNMALMAGTLLAFHDRAVKFDVISTSGAGAVVALLWLAPKGRSPEAALRNIVNLSVSDPIYQGFPVNYKVFNKPGAYADFYRYWLGLLPGMSSLLDQYEKSMIQRWFSDLVQLGFATFCPSDLNPFSFGLCAPLPFIDGVIDFTKVKSMAPPYFYVNAYNVDALRMDDFAKDVITADHIRAALGFPFIYGPFRLGEHRYYEGAVVDCVNYKDVTQKHPGLETLVVLDVLGAPSLIRPPRNLYDSWVLSMIIPLVSNAQDDTELFMLKYNNGHYLKRDGATRDLLKVEYDIPDAHLIETLDWSVSNANRLFDIGYKAGEQLCRDYPEALGLGGEAPSALAPVKRATRMAAAPGTRVPAPVGEGEYSQTVAQG
jgi:NTE family protein